MGRRYPCRVQPGCCSCLNCFSPCCDGGSSPAKHVNDGNFALVLKLDTHHEDEEKDGFLFCRSAAAGGEFALPRHWFADWVGGRKPVMARVLEGGSCSEEWRGCTSRRRGEVPAVWRECGCSSAVSLACRVHLRGFAENMSGTRTDPPWCGTYVLTRSFLRWFRIAAVTRSGFGSFSKQPQERWASGCRWDPIDQSVSAGWLTDGIDQ